jgi:hypothetical protein
VAVRADNVESKDVFEIWGKSADKKPRKREPAESAKWENDRWVGESVRQSVLGEVSSYLTLLAQKS